MKTFFRGILKKINGSVFTALRIGWGAFVLLSVFLFSSCSTMLYTSIDVLRPAKVTFDKNATQLLLLNNSPVQPPEKGHMNYLHLKKAYGVALAHDSTAFFCLNALEEDLNDKGFFQQVNLQTTSVNPNKNSNKIVPLNQPQVIHQCLFTNSNVLLSLDRILVKDELHEYFLEDSNSYLATLEMHVTTNWSIHYPDRSEVKNLQFTDTVYWQSESYQQKNALNELPRREDALVDAALDAGHKCTDRFTPYWEKADRYFYNNNNKYMKQGMDSVYVRNWTAAIACWEKAYSQAKSHRVKAQAANNMAVGYEIVGDMNKAIQYATDAYYSFGEMSFSDGNTLLRLGKYINDLNKRKEDIELLGRQLGEK